MTLITHLKVSGKPAPADTSEVGGPDWDADHVINATSLTAALSAFTTSLKGLAPASGGGTTNFLRADGTWSVPPAPSLAAIATSGSATDLIAGTVPAARMPAHTGDVTSSAGAVALTIVPHAVTLAQQAPVAANRIMGNNTGSTADQIALTITQILAMLGIRLGEFADGSDGTVIMDGSTAVAGCTLSGSIYTATRSVFFANLTINSGVTFKPDGWPVYVQTTLTNNGAIRCDGSAGVGTASGAPATSGSRLLPVNVSNGTASSSAPQVFPSSSAVNGAGSVGSAGSNGPAGTAGTLGRGGGGGAGGNNNPFTAQGVGGNSSPSVSPATAIGGDARVKFYATTGKNTSGTAYTLGTAGGAGGGSDVAGGGGGGLGGAGGWVVIQALITAGTGVWSAVGGAGGNGGNGGSSGAAGAGGGGGGAGGYFVLITGGGTGPTIAVSGGSGGSGGASGGGGAGTGGAGGAGGAGYALVL